MFVKSDLWPFHWPRLLPLQHFDDLDLKQPIRKRLICVQLSIKEACSWIRLAVKVTTLAETRICKGSKRSKLPKWGVTWSLDKTFKCSRNWFCRSEEGNNSGAKHNDAFPNWRGLQLCSFSLVCSYAAKSGRGGGEQLLPKESHAWFPEGLQTPVLMTNS